MGSSSSIGSWPAVNSCNRHLLLSGDGGGRHNRSFLLGRGSKR